PIAYRFETLFPNAAIILYRLRQILRLQNSGVNADDQNLFVMRAVEDANLAAFGQRLLTSPKEIVIELFGRRLFERHDMTALRINSAHHVLDGAVLAGRIHRLEDYQQ